MVLEDFYMPQKKLNATDFSDLGAAAGEAEYDFYVLENFSNGYDFSTFNLTDTETDDGETIKKIVIRYLHPNGVAYVDLVIYPMEQEKEHTILYEETKEIAGEQVSRETYILRLVKEDYVMTEEDWDLYHSGKYGFACDGVREGDEYFYTLYFVKDGIYYEFTGATETILPLVDFEKMLKEFISEAQQKTFLGK